MVLAVNDHVRFYSSSDLKSWNTTGEFGREHGSHKGVWECPDLFPLKVEGTNQTKWVLLLSINPGGLNGGSATQYFIGDFDGRAFKNDNASDKILWLDGGRDNYAGVTWSNAPNNRRIFLGWMSNWDYGQKVPTQGWRSAMTLPREFSLRQTSQGVRLFQNPVKETETLRAEEVFRAKNRTVERLLRVGEDRSPLREMLFVIDLSKTTANDLGVELSNRLGETFRVGYDKARNAFYTDRTKAGKYDFSPRFAGGRIFSACLSNERRLKLQLIFDVASVELFADDGANAMTEIFFPSEDFSDFQFFSTGGTTLISNAEAWRLKSVWP